jgi:hypothetical protein
VNHSQIIARLNALEHVSAVQLVGRCTVNVPWTDSYLFVSDLHLMSAERRGLFPYSFDHDRSWAGGDTAVRHSSPSCWTPCSLRCGASR